MKKTSKVLEKFSRKFMWKKGQKLINRRIDQRGEITSIQEADKNIYGVRLVHLTIEGSKILQKAMQSAFENDGWEVEDVQ